jgi:hypothetical protein
MGVEIDPAAVRPSWQTPLIERTLRLDIAASLFNQISETSSAAEVDAAARNYETAHAAYVRQLERTTGLPAEGIAARLNGFPASSPTPSSVDALTEGRSFWRPPLMFDLNTRVVTISPAWVLLACALTFGLTVLGSVLMAALP